MSNASEGLIKSNALIKQSAVKGALNSSGRNKGTNPETYQTFRFSGVVDSARLVPSGARLRRTVIFPEAEKQEVVCGRRPSYRQESHL